MAVFNPCKSFTRKDLKFLNDFLNSNPQILKTLPRASQDHFLKLCGYVAHLRSKRSSEFVILTYNTIGFLNGVHDKRR
ncbi:MAG: hypothetical protein ACP5U1_16420, partial [Desulfomonilaceae bacterium]